MPFPTQPRHMVRRLSGCMLAWLGLVLLTACGRPAEPQFTALPQGSTVLVVGDSLVAGTGAAAGRDWPAGLAQRTGWDVVNAGVPGDTTADAQRRLGELIDTHQPQAIVLAIGGNDFLRNVPPERTRANLDAMLRASLAATGHVALVAIPAKSVGAALAGRLADHPLYAELAATHPVAQVPEVVADVLSRDELRADRIHANAAGYARIADGVADALARQGWIAR